MMKKNLIIATALAVVLLSGCKTNEQIYYYGTYSENLYQHFNADDTSVGEQISELEETVEKAANKSLPIAPGILAHLGYLHLKQGNRDSGFDYLEKEKSLYPESEKYINFLLKNATGAVQ